MGHFADEHEVRVDPGAAVLQPRGNREGLADVLRPDRRREAVVRVVSPRYRVVGILEPRD